VNPNAFGQMLAPQFEEDIGDLGSITMSFVGRLA
jgi:hypothetical protein